jgi:hypothetical protein
MIAAILSDPSRPMCLDAWSRLGWDLSGIANSARASVPAQTVVRNRFGYSIVVRVAEAGAT